VRQRLECGDAAVSHDFKSGRGPLARQTDIVSQRQKRERRRTQTRRRPTQTNNNKDLV
jgi:hypothetical protein